MSVSVSDFSSAPTFIIAGEAPIARSIVCHEDQNWFPQSLGNNEALPSAEKIDIIYNISLRAGKYAMLSCNLQQLTKTFDTLKVILLNLLKCIHISTMKFTLGIGFNPFIFLLNMSKLLS